MTNNGWWAIKPNQLSTDTVTHNYGWRPILDNNFQETSYKNTIQQVTAKIHWDGLQFVKE